MTTGRGARRPVPQDHGGREGRDPRAEEHHQHDGRPAQRRSPREVTRVAREVGTEGKLGGQAQVAGVGGTWKDLTDNVNFMAVEPHRAGARHREGGDRRRQRQPDAAPHRAGQGRGRGARRHHQQHDRHAGDVRRSGDQRGARGRRRRAASAARPTCPAPPARGRTSPATSTCWPRTSPRRCARSPRWRPP